MSRAIWHHRKSMAIFFVTLIIIQLVQVPVVYALTSGPSQPETQSFQPAGASEMVDLFTGDFSYNIPLFELPGPNGGYPFNLSYQSGIGMDQEASWVGLGFSLNPGAINRQMRGLPDEFNGDPVYTKMSIDPSVTVGLGAGVSGEFFGAANIGLGLGVSQNNYKGFGYSIDGSIGFGKTVGNGMTEGIGLNVSLNSKEGVGVNPSLTLGSKLGDFGLGAGYNSKAGLYNVSLSHSHNYGVDKNLKVAKKLNSRNQSTISSSLSLVAQGYTPQVSMPMRSVNISATFKAGASWWGAFANAYVTGFYNEQWLKEDKKRVRSDAFGYMNYQNSGGSKDLLDFNREKDGIVSKETPNLGIPSLTYDIYSVTGQGIGAMYRPMRNDYGIVHDPTTVSKSTSGSAGADVAPILSHVGVNLSVNHSESQSGEWSENNNMAAIANFKKDTINSLYEPWYFKVHGEPSSRSIKNIEQIGGDEAVRVKLTGSNSSPQATNVLENNVWNAPLTSLQGTERKSRNQVIQMITNDELLNDEGDEMNTFFKVKYEDKYGNPQNLDRSTFPGHHPAGLTALTPEGLRYNYAIPAYNYKQEEVTYTAKKNSGQVARTDVVNEGNGDPKYTYNNTEKYLKSIEIPPYAHSYLLTSIVGPDYVDVLADGVTPDDLGYWVKFTYQQAATSTDPYKWRDPFSQAHYIEGWKTDPRDDKGQFVYGEKDIWYLAKAETRSHIATFTLQDREDGRGVSAKLQDVNNTGKILKKLTEIKLFTRSAGGNYPIKTVRFEYDYSLCPGVYNNPSGGGKLTLKKVWFEYGSSLRGQLNPYHFTYNQSNPGYDMNAYDRWGNYKPYPIGDYDSNRDFPYTDQDPLHKEIIDNSVSSWSLSKIDLPSGAEMLIDYETDDYAYIQHLQAMQMTQIVDPYQDADQVLGNEHFNLRDDNMKIRFRLERPIPGEQSVDEEEEVLKYLDEKRGQIYFKSKINLRSSGEGFLEYISGYADIDFSQLGLEKDGSGDYVFGYFYLKSEEGHNPFSLRAWQHLRTNQPDLANSGRKIKQTESTSERIKQIKSLGSVFAQLRQMFEGFYDYCDKKGWGREVVANKSWIRLKSPDLVKYGGGLRVRQITLKDQWQYDNDGVYGQIYEYTKKEEGLTISSGVAAYEPFIGGEENALRYAKKYSESIPLRADNNLFFEYPVNESYYPRPQVGYEKVSVLSLAAAYQAGKEVKHLEVPTGGVVFPESPNPNFGSSGMTVHEFYTAKEFPVITDETEKKDKPYQLSVPVPFLGNISISKLTSSQGYSIVTNDMHGKLKKISNYRQNVDGDIEKEPISWVQYNYLSTPTIYGEENVNVVASIFKTNEDGSLSVATSEDILDPEVQKVEMGKEQELFMDMRQYNDKSWGGGVRGNLDVVFIPILFAIIPIPIPTVWPNISKTSHELNTAVTNKVTFRKGIIKSIEAYDGGSVIETQHVKWDRLTGSPVLSTVTNNFDEPVYQYQLPAYRQYQGMGAAYLNIGLKFELDDIVPLSGVNDGLYQFLTPVGNNLLFPGDEILLYAHNGEFNHPLASAIYRGKEDGVPILQADTELSDASYDAKILRSGRRNQLQVNAGSITALEDPSKRGTLKTYSKTIVIPNE